MSHGGLQEFVIAARGHYGTMERDAKTCGMYAILREYFQYYISDGRSDLRERTVNYQSYSEAEHEQFCTNCTGLFTDSMY